MHWDLRFAEANLVVADLLGAALGGRARKDDQLEDRATPTEE
ncbi:MAG: hypothetical protein ACRDKA_11315 [Actinomycetota bacterium]